MADKAQCTLILLEPDSRSFDRHFLIMKHQFNSGIEAFVIHAGETVNADKQGATASYRELGRLYAEKMRELA